MIFTDDKRKTELNAPSTSIFWLTTFYCFRLMSKMRSLHVSMQWDSKTPLLPACKKFCSPYITFNLKPVWFLRVFFTHFFPVFKFNSLLDISTDQVFQPDFVRTTKFCKISITVCNGWGRKSMYLVLRQKWKRNSFWKNVTQTNETYNICFHLICEHFFTLFPA